MHIPNQNISKLDLSDKNLTSIPKEVFGLKNLRKLNLSGNKLKNIPKEIERLELLENLDISNNHISNFYAKICQLRKLKKLNLNNNSIRQIPRQIENLKNLYTFSIANNKIENLPKEFSNLEGLNQLNISKNPIEFFPKEILEIKALKQVWINNLNLKNFPIEDILGNLPNLKSIYCYGQIENRVSVNETYKELSKIKGNCLADLIVLSRKKEKSDKIVTNTKEKLKSTKNKIFISYSHNDENWLTKVMTNLKVLHFDQNESFDVWNDKRIKSGANWKEEIEAALDEASIAILLVSTDFLASDFIQSNELPALLKSAERKGTKIIPLIVGHCRFTKNKNISQFQAVNDPSKPLSECSKADIERTLVKLADDVESYL